MIKPILFSAPMVRALLDGRKTQTRRVLKPQPYGDVIHYGWEQDAGARWTDQSFDSYRLPFWVGDLLWVREAHKLIDRHCDYRADWPEGSQGHFSWRPSIHMPRWASRLTLRVTDVRVQRLQEISEADAVAEGVAHDQDRSRGNCIAWRDYLDRGGKCATGTASFRSLWDSLNAGRGYGWDANPWVAAYTFEVIRENVDDLIRSGSQPQ
ncbi:hypothetical protein [Maritimibacter sp. DP1N21-5]|uniref:hypothetical protein n=1 Tax=Maritimibacter sp. DP1N21-5 TaxID=2836867 RepID=UPI001C483514|nr:hypothetical protein [Maritimibacter sp. DP1N21-5]MBV7408709.1 hypothetical protein [Maritimibacter sp. DP1N21-5]